MRSLLICLALALAAAAPARATLLGNTVGITGNYGTLPPDNLGVQLITNAGASYAATGNTGTDFLVTPTQIRLTNKLTNTAFCVALNATPCTDAFNGFTFTFGGAISPAITAVTVNAATPADFRPLAPLFVSPNVVSLNLVGLVPRLNSVLIIDLAFAEVPPPTAAPEPVSVLVLGAALAGLGAARRRRA